MISFKKTGPIETLTKLKAGYMQQTTAPLDGMWLCGFVPMANHFSILSNGETVGFYCVNDEGYLMQFFLVESHWDQSAAVFKSIVEGAHASPVEVKGAFVSTAEPYYLSLCLDRFSKFEVNARMYQSDRTGAVDLNQVTADLSLLEPSQLEPAVNFAAAAIGAPVQWLTAYYANLIRRQELYGVWCEGELVATGERRGFDEYQEDYVDLGVIVAESERGRGLATRVLKQLVVMNESEGLKSICSTEQSNVAAQTAIDRAGFVTNNRILQFHA